MAVVGGHRDPRFHGEVDAFSKLIAPANPEEFFKHVWQRQAQVFRSDGEWNRPIPRQSWEDCCNLFAYVWGAAPVPVPDGCDFVVFQGKQMSHSYQANGPCFAIIDGASCVANHAEYVWPPFMDLCVSLRKRLVHVYCNSYVTPPGTQAAPPHADDRDVFILQLCGRKSWRVWDKPPIKLPYSDEQVGKGDLDVPGGLLAQEPTMKIVLGPGDVLYMPRGFVHEAFCLEDTSSWHATLAVATHDWSWSKVLSSTVAHVLDHEASAKWREAVPLNLGLGGGDFPSDESIEGCLEEMFGYLRKELRASDLSDRFKDKVARHNRMQDNCFADFSTAVANFLNHCRDEEEDVWPFFRRFFITFDTVVKKSTSEESENSLQRLGEAFLRSKGKGKGKGIPRFDGFIVRPEVVPVVQEALVELGRRSDAGCNASELRAKVLASVDCPHFDELTALCFMRAGVTTGALRPISGLRIAADLCHAKVERTDPL